MAYGPPIPTTFTRSSPSTLSSKPLISTLWPSGIWCVLGGDTSFSSLEGCVLARSLRYTCSSVSCFALATARLGLRRFRICKRHSERNPLELCLRQSLKRSHRPFQKQPASVSMPLSTHIITLVSPTDIPWSAPWSSRRSLCKTFPRKMDQSITRLRSTI